MNYFTIALFLIFSMEAMGITYKCGSGDRSRLAVEINDTGSKAVLNFTALDGNAPLVVRTDAFKIYQGLAFEFIIDMKGQASLKRGRSSIPFKCISGARGIDCKSNDGRSAIKINGVLLELSENIGTPKQSFVRTEAVLIYQTAMGMEVKFMGKGNATYSGSKRKGAIVDSRSIKLNCK